MLLLGYDLGSSSIKASVIDAATGRLVASASAPGQEMDIASPRPGWAEQDPELWWRYVQEATAQLRTKVNLQEVGAIGISYQMHGLVVVDQQHKVLRPSIIWCDSRAVGIGEKAFEELGPQVCLSDFLNSPGNFTASKLKWVKDHEPEVFAKIHRIMLPGDYLAMRLTGEINTTVSGLSEGILWNFREGGIATNLLDHYGLSTDMLPTLVPTFGPQGEVSAEMASVLGFRAGIPVAYRAGDQPNNAFSLNVLNPGEVAATAGTSGVVYGINDDARYDAQSRVNTFVHVNHQPMQPRYGVLLCVNGTGIQNSWLRNKLLAGDISYPDMNRLAAEVPVGAEGVRVLPFGNGAERVLSNQQVGGQVLGLDFNRHDRRHLLRAAQEGIVFALNYGMEVMKSMGMGVDTVRAGDANMFLSPVFRQTFANVTGAVVELYNTDGAQGAARGAGVGAKVYAALPEAFTGLQATQTIEPKASERDATQAAYEAWHRALKTALRKQEEAKPVVS
ncbi:xylulokinase [Catalinimonas alkaloidigena]|uniref:Xylulokinase n=1 Tax=Catalinimonas alkaloidigena TaxID=1075417 RepID=A0A1G9N6R8_9BACT|nr:FGGY family carbohydrate kinase [Catalinimonas alkaloidigena]SDL82242.1 xylulokinase [Catalinimonas alkaloidigena]